MKALKSAERFVTQTQAQNMVIELHNLVYQRKLIESREDELKKSLADYVHNTINADTKGHFNFSVLGSDGRSIVFQRQARKKIALKESETLRFLRKNKLTDAIIEREIVAPEVTQDQIVEALIKAGYNAYIDVIEEVDEIVLEQLVKENKITMREFESLCEVNTTYATLCDYEDKMQKNAEKYENKKGGK